MESIATHVRRLVLVQYVSIAGAVVYSYDWALTFGAEMQFFWTTKRGRLGAYLFLFTRYSPVIGLSIGLIELNPFTARLSDQMYVKTPLITRCRAAKVIGILAQIVMSTASTGIFCLRICALYHEDKKMKALILLCFYLSVAAQIALGALAISSVLPLVKYGRVTCVLSGPQPAILPKIVAGSYLSMVPCEIMILLATYLHAMKAKKQHVLNRESSALLVLRRMYQDGATYFLLAFGTRLAGAIMWLVYPPDFKFFLGLRELMFRPTIETQRTTTLDGSLFVDTYSLPAARTRNTDPTTSEDIGLSVISPRDSKGDRSTTGT